MCYINYDEKYCMFQILVVIYLAGLSLSYLPVLEQSALAL